MTSSYARSQRTKTGKKQNQRCFTFHSPLNVSHMPNEYIPVTRTAKCGGFYGNCFSRQKRVHLNWHVSSWRWWFYTVQQEYWFLLALSSCINGRYMCSILCYLPNRMVSSSCIQRNRWQGQPHWIDECWCRKFGSCYGWMICPLQWILIWFFLRKRFVLWTFAQVKVPSRLISK